ncbi:hypothetical protein ACIQ8D_13675 [Streptomyces sp. NPDC096094]|uniref:hypothetical protein n=1 Tax=Streptomyces sp. NPDC096094 TaxID=3366073 RepID=UPI003828EA02
MTHISFSVPVEFEEMPLGADFDDVWVEIRRRCVRASTATKVEQNELAELARTLHKVSRFLDKVGVVYAADCAHMFEGVPSTGSLAVAVVEFPYGRNADTAVRGAVRGILQSRGSEWAGSAIEAPCGPSAVFTGGQAYTVPSVFTPNGEPIDVLTAQFHAIIPIPAQAGVDGQHMCLLAFATPNIDHWERCYAPIMVSVLRSLRFSEEGQTDADAEPTAPGEGRER